MSAIDSITLEIVRNQLEGIAEEMGQVLIRGAYSPNIKERQDCSAALFDADGRMVAQAEHIPVHLGAMPQAVAAIRDKNPAPDEAYILNDPFLGGTHLPDITIVSPIAPEGVIIGYAVTRAHHADVGGMAPGSMPAGATEIYQEGVRIPNIRLVNDGEVDENVLNLLVTNMRNPNERRADLRAQLAANNRAENRIGELLDELEAENIDTVFDAVIEYSHDRIKAELAEFPDGTFSACDVLEGDGVTDDDIPITVTVTINGSDVTVDFMGTASEVEGNLNAPLAVAKSAVYFVFRAVTDPGIPPNHGCYAPISIEVPEGSLLNPNAPRAVVGGNVETSQRVMDVVLDACREAVPDCVPAQGQGTMNNLIIGSRGDNGFTYYETIGGGFGARPNKDGLDGVQVGMTNTLNTPIEALELEYPMRVEQYALRSNSGGAGTYRGGLGLERSITVEADAVVSLLTERRQCSPRGAGGGADGRSGENKIDGKNVGAKTVKEISEGTTVTVLTPGGGGYGKPDDRNKDAIKTDKLDDKVSERKS